MRKNLIWLAVAAMVAVLTTSAEARLSDFVGNWENTDRNTRGVTRLEITASGANVRVRAWGSCTPRDCDWGTTSGVPYAAKVDQNLARNANVLSVRFNQGFAETIMIIRKGGGRKLKVQTYTRFTDGGKRSNYTRNYTFGPAAAPQVQIQPVPAPTPTPQPVKVKEDCISFKFLRAKVQQNGGRWKIAVGKMWLLDFGNDKSKAEQALKIIRGHRLNKQCFVGRPNPSMEYFLSGNKAPKGRQKGEDCNAFNPASTRVQSVQGRWKIADGSHWILDFGANQAEANQAYRIIKKYKFSNICFVGRPNPPMTYFRR